MRTVLSVGYVGALDRHLPFAFDIRDTESAASLYRDVLDWCEEPRRHEAREALFIALAGSPAMAARRGLAALES